MGSGFEVTFYGVRGSTPCHGDDIARFGGNTSCVSVDVPDHDPILFDLGTGARYFGLGCDGDRPFHGTCLVSHLHWDHVQGLPFFPPLLRPDGTLDVYAPDPGDGRSIGDVVRASLCPPLFPVPIDELPGTATFRSVGDEEFSIGDIKVTTRSIPHVGNTIGYRLDWGGASVAYLSDHQQPGVDVYDATAGALELCDGVGLLIHDAQYTRSEFERKSDWGHCTAEYAAWIATEAGAARLALFHHDPMHDDDQVDAIVAAIRAGCTSNGLEVFAAAEGSTVVVTP